MAAALSFVAAAMASVAGTSATRPLLANRYSPPSAASCDQACSYLAKNTSLQVSPLADGAYYWAQQIVEIVPACYVRPTSAKQVSTVVQAASEYKCPFAIRGGGHSDVPGASNIAKGITIDLGALNQVAVSDDKTVTHVGPGCSWGDVYNALDPHQLTVIGGRESSVGIAGLTLGGGISYLSGLHGFACDNVANFEVVLADGCIVNANYSSKYADLYKSLRGGGNNFGVVVRFDLDTYHQGNLKGGLVTWSDSPGVENALISAFSYFMHHALSAPDASLFIAISYSPMANSFEFVASPTYAKPVTTIPAIYTPLYTALLNKSQTYSSERIASMGNLSDELNETQPSGLRVQFHTATMGVSNALQSQIMQIFRNQVQKTIAIGLHNSTGFAPALAFQSFTAPFLSHGSKTGGNVLGIDAASAPLMVLSMSWSWVDPRDDATVIGGMRNIIQQSKAAAKEAGLGEKFEYMNYAAPGTSPLLSYGQEDHEFLKSTSQKYDPDQVFQRLVPGGFKLDGWHIA